MPQFETHVEIKASGAYEPVRNLAHLSTDAQARDVELVERVPSNNNTGSSQPSKQYFVRRRYVFGGNGETSAAGTRYLWSEYESLRKLQHPYLVRYVDFEYMPRRNNVTASIYTEYCEGGDLSQYSWSGDNAGRTISEKQFWWIFYQLASAVLYCHTGLRVDERNVAVDSGWKRPLLHRNITPANGM